jgi:mono/diheme cytochrome c family protein
MVKQAFSFMNRGHRRLIVTGIAALLVTSGCGDRVERGRELYAKHGCAVCHGQEGRGDGPAARTLNPPPRDFADVGGYQQGASEDAIAASIRNGVRTSRTMPAFTHLATDEIELLARWIVSLQNDTGPSVREGSP